MRTFAHARLAERGRPTDVMAWFAMLAFGALAPRAFGDEVPRGYLPKPGESHPEIRLRTIEDPRVVALSDFRGKKVLLLHFASW